MSREIRFRGKRIDNGQWVYGQYFITPLTDENSGTTPDAGWFFLSGEQRHCIVQNGVAFVIDVETVGQLTGLTDRNEKPIYEGDIVRFLDAYMHGEDGDWDDCVCTGQIKWDDELAQFYVTNRESMDNEDFWEQANEAEVIGDIYTTPHLIES